ncbi:Asp23/Gls24 family envelope stress response protein [Microlunatus antarcticus]|uniref:Putative alkaline shock family protein YloU n=1 Tax=Microlunatus antarcticus TaxID=53388 RepID=A0A7W5JWA3_9ACTN|nr:Asp23/Gls24 family envelope stress response protein [Microlunatus antarcticus]MBB3327438.1 putative alkaline shock family protein YloU [Microlunatus antarcticus]
MSAVATTPAERGGRADPRRRGRLVLADRVVEKIAGQAAAEVAATAGRSGGFLGIGSDADTTARPKVDVTLSSESADLAVAVGIAYPGSIRRATQELRDHVTERVETLTGVDVRRVDIDVTFLALADGPAKGALR